MPKSTPIKKAAPKRKGAKGFKLPDPIPKGEILTDQTKQKWQIGPSIGVGGFGEIYSASNVTESFEKKSSDYPFVIKVEPHDNGPLFVEMHFYMRVGKLDEINAWIQQKKLHGLGMPRFIGSGSHEVNGEKYRFVVMDRFSKDLWSLFLDHGRIFPIQTVLRVGYQIINTLEYIHSKSYVHADIKGANLLLGIKKGFENQVYLVDFGMACKYSKDSKPDPKKAHNGTPEYTSRDAHVGVMSMRGDMEILGYNLLQWLCSTLPWESDIGNVLKLHQQKVSYMSNIPDLMKKCFPKTSAPAFIVEFFEYLSKMSIADVPDYDYCRTLIKNGLKKCAHTLEGKLEFALPKKSPTKVTKVQRGKAKAEEYNEDDDDEIIQGTPPKKSRQDKAHTNGALKTLVTRRRKVAVSISSSDDESDDNDSLKNQKKHQPKSEASSSKKNVIPIKPSWRDCPTAAASNVTRPGEYKSVNGSAAKPKKRQ